MTNTVHRRTPSLRELQRWMAARILAPGRFPTPNPVGDAASTPLAAPPAGEIGERMHVYAGAYPTRVGEALAESFPAVAHVVGAAAFAGLVRRYVEVVPLRSYNLNDAGTDFPRFLCGDPLTTRLPFLPDLALLEWRVARAFHATEGPPFDGSKLAGWSLDDWEGAVFRFRPSVALVVSEWPIREIWEARDTPVEAIDVDLCDRPDRVLVRRCGPWVTCESIGATEAGLLEMLLAGQPLGSVVAGLAEAGVESAAVASYVSRYAAQGMFGDFSRNGEGTAPGSRAEGD